MAQIFPDKHLDDGDRPSAQPVLFGISLPRALFIAGLAFTAVAVILWQGISVSRNIALGEIDRTGAERLALYRSALSGALTKFDYLPDAVTHYPSVVRLLAGNGSEGVGGYVNRRLEALARRSGAAALYVLDSNGITLAASNWNESGSFVGHDYRFRPYFKDAIAGRTGRFFAIGVTTGLPGFFISEPVRRGDGAIVGVAHFRPI